MAKIDLARRAEIGRERRARTRRQVARTLYAARPINSVTVDGVVGTAGVAKGTFHVHFASLSDLQGIVADERATASSRSCP